MKIKNGTCLRHRTKDFIIYFILYFLGLHYSLGIQHLSGFKN